MEVSAQAAVAMLLKIGKPEEVVELRVHDFADEEEAHDDELIDRLHEEFAADFKRACAELSERFGPPVRAGEGDDDAIPLGGVSRFAIWETGDRTLFLAVDHEDRELPVVLSVGITEPGWRR